VRRNLAFAKRRMAKGELDGIREIGDVIQRIKEAENDLQAALEASTEIELLRPGLYVELGRIYRDMGRAMQKNNADEKEVESWHHKSREFLQKALRSGELDPLAEADAKQDLAEECFHAGLNEDVSEYLKEVENLVPSNYRIIPGKQIPATDLSGEYFLPLGKVEWLRGEIGFTEGDYFEGLKHFCLAYAYFGRFSPNASEVEGMVQFIYSHLQKLELAQLKSLISAIRGWIEENNLSIDMNVFFENIHSLLGV
jgi:tetratricopeptide (TPR) repeat protein